MGAKSAIDASSDAASASPKLDRYFSKLERRHDCRLDELEPVAEDACDAES